MEQKNETFNPQMLILARESRGLLQGDIATMLAVSAGKIHYVEHGELTLDDKEMDKVCKGLRYPKNFFTQQGDAYLTTSINFRKRQNVAQKLLTPVLANISIYRMNIETLMEGLKLEAPKLTIVDMNKCKTPQDAAKKLREHWKVRQGAIDNLTELLEKNNIIVISFDFNTDRIDSRTVLTKALQPVLVINKRMSGDRQRFSLAYELGHLVMHSLAISAMDRDIDHEANLFAAEFLLPEKDIRSDFEGADITLRRLGELKLKWKASMQALLYRAEDLGYLTPNQKKYLLSQFNAAGIRRKEPQEYEMAKEKPLLIRDLMTKFRTLKRITIKELASTFRLDQDDFIQRYGD